MRYNKVRGILRAKQGSQIPKFLTAWGPIEYNPNILGSMTPIPKLDATLLPSYQLYQADIKAGLNYAQELRDRGVNAEDAARMVYRDSQNGWGASASGKWRYKKPIKSSTTIEKNNLKTNSQEFNSQSLKANLVGSMIGQGADMISSMFAFDKDGYLGKYGALQQTGDQVFDLASNAVMQINPLVGGIMKAGGLVSDVLTTYGGMGTDSMTKTDAILGSKLLSLTPVGMINGFFGKKTKLFGVNYNTLELVGGSYGGSTTSIMDAKNKSNKKYGLLSGGSRRDANRQTIEARRLLNVMTDIADTTADLRAMINDLNYTNYQFDINGGYDQRYMRAAKSGMKIQDKIDFIKLRKTINNSINLETKLVEWEPIIEDIVEEFKDGGNLPELWEPIIEDLWEPVIEDIESYKEGGKTKEELETPEIEETNQKNLIPEGALHKNKHHMEHTEGLTLKGIPVIDNDGELLAEIELDEIIFTLEVTKKLEELYKDGSDEAAVEAGKLLVKEILFNTDDRTGLIAKCEEGGKL